MRENSSQSKKRENKLFQKEHHFIPLIQKTILPMEMKKKEAFQCNIIVPSLNISSDNSVSVRIYSIIYFYDDLNMRKI